MMDNILNLIKETVSSSISKSAEVPANKQTQTVDTMTKAVTDGLKSNFTLDNILNITNLFKNGSSVDSNPITNNIVASVATTLMQKIGLSQQVASMLSTAVVPLVMKAISGKVNDPKEKGFDIESLIKTFTGKETGGLLGSLGKLFG